MNRLSLITASLRHYARSSTAIGVGVFLCSAIITGALLVGDSVDKSLSLIADSRLGSITYTMTFNDRTFADDLPERLMGTDAVSALGADSESINSIASILSFRGIVSRLDEEARINNASIHGVSSSFFKMSPLGSPLTIPSGEAWLNQQTANQLEVTIGDQVSVKVPRPSNLPSENAWDSERDNLESLTVTISRILDKQSFANFGLRNEHIIGPSVFIDRTFFQKKMELRHRANTLLLATEAHPLNSLKKPKMLQTWFLNALTSADLDLTIIPSIKSFEIESRRMFIDEPLSRHLASHSLYDRRLITYFVNDIASHDEEKHLPYSMVAAIEDRGLFPNSIPQNSIVLNSVAADQMDAKIGELVKVSWYEPGNGIDLVAKSKDFTVHAIRPFNDFLEQGKFVPTIPGLTDAESCGEWDKSLPINLDNMSDKDQEYWASHRHIPRAFISFETGKQLWSNRYGDLTAMRLNHTYLGPQTFRSLLLGDKSSLEGAFVPADLGFNFIYAAGAGDASVLEAFPFESLFLGFSFFLIVSASLLIALLFSLMIEHRSSELGMLKAIGYSDPLAMRLLLQQVVFISLLFGIPGAFAGSVYAKYVLEALTGVWSAAVGTSDLRYYYTVSSYVSGTCASFIISIFVSIPVVRRLLRRPTLALLEARTTYSFSHAGLNMRTYPIVLSSLLVLGALTWCFINPPSTSPDAQVVFFTSGFILLIAGLVIAREFIRAMPVNRINGLSDTLIMSFKNASRNPTRSMTVVSLIASSCFLVIAVGVNKHDASHHSEDRHSPTGGFTLHAKSAFPMFNNLFESENNFSFKDYKSISAVAFKAKDGDDASCLNLNKAQHPRILGVKPDDFISRDAFSFLKTDPSLSFQGWKVLQSDPGGGIIPVVGDQSTLQWALQLKVGDRLGIIGDDGQQYVLHIAGMFNNSILQGNLIMSQDNFNKLFINSAGYMEFLVDSKPEDAKKLAATLSKEHEAKGLELVTTVDRMNTFFSVENTYLSIFMALGGLGVIFGIAGLGVLAARNLVTRKAEFALLQAVGYSNQRIHLLVIAEYGLLIIIGLDTGLSSACLASWPTIITQGTAFPYLAVACFILLIICTGLFWIYIAALMTLKGSIPQNLQAE